MGIIIIIIIIIISGSRGKNRNFIDKFHARSGTYRGSRTRWLFERVNRTIRRGRDRRSGRRDVRTYSYYQYEGESVSLGGSVKEYGDEGN